MNTKKRKIASKTAQNEEFSLKTSESLIELTTVLKSVDTKSKEAKLNETSMDDNNGGRITFNWLFGLMGKKKKDK